MLSKLRVYVSLRGSRMAGPSETAASPLGATRALLPRVGMGAFVELLMSGDVGCAGDGGDEGGNSANGSALHRGQRLFL